MALILTVAANLPQAQDFASLLDTLAEQGDIQEQIALYQGFAFYPQHPALLARAREAVRNGMRPVFAAFALRNPWPLHGLPQDAWNQMVVKTFFLDLPLWPVQGLAQRANPALTQILLDLAAERQAAGRPRSAELWRMVALCPGPRGLAALQAEYAQAQAAQDQTRLQALALALQQSDAAELAELRSALQPDTTHRDWPQFAPWQE